MSWAINMQNASFRGVRFDVTATTDEVTRDKALYEYPNVDGADVHELGRKPRNYSLTAMLWGDRYEYSLQRLTAALDEPGAGELIHPIYGAVASVIVTRYQVRHDADAPDSCTVDISFLENRTGTALFSTALPEMLGGSLFDTLDQLTDDLANFYDAVTTPLKGVQSLIKRAQTAQATLLNTLLTFGDDTTMTVEQMTALAGSPGAFVSALADILERQTGRIASGVPALASATVSTVVDTSATAARASAPVASSSTVISAWNAIVSQMDSLVALPEQFVSGDITPIVALSADASPDDVQDVIAVYRTAAVTELASAATAILSDDEQTAALTPDDIERLVSDVRTRCKRAVSFVRTRYTPERATLSETPTPVGLLYRPLVDGLKTTALALQNLAVSVLARRPPLTQKTVSGDSCLRLLAHLWYGDHTRAAELERLNPQLREPNNVINGTVLNAYAK